MTDVTGSIMDFLAVILDDIIRPLVSVSVLTWYIIYRYIYDWDWQYLNNVIIIKTKILLPRAFVTLADFTIRSFWFCCSPKIIKLFGFPIFSTIQEATRVYLMKVIPEKCLLTKLVTDIYVFIQTNTVFRRFRCSLLGHNL